MYLFGIDLPLVEMFFIFLILGIITVGALIYLLVSILQTNKKMYLMLQQEKKNLKEVSDLTDDEKKTLHNSADAVQNLVDDMKRLKG